MKRSKGVGKVYTGRRMGKSHLLYMLIKSMLETGEYVDSEGVRILYLKDYINNDNSNIMENIIWDEWEQENEKK